MSAPAVDAAPACLLGASPVDFYRHTMSVPSLRRYLEIKVHHLIQDHDWARIRVIGDYDRTSVISTNEKNDKLFNWQRPTAEFNAEALTVKCFPGVDYVHHYALIIATYLNIVGRYRGQVDYELPDESLCEASVARLNVDPSTDDLVVLGWGLGRFAGGTQWTPGHGYAWKRAEVEGRRVLYLGYLHSIWGDVAGRVVSRLAALGARRVVYVGKVGSLDSHIAPNTSLATGNSSVMAEGRVSWRDFFDDLAIGQPDTCSGVHVTSPSILLEGENWLAGQHGHRFVDPEIGHMGRAAHAADIEFGFLHVISNNLAHAYPVDLSNERLATVVERRTHLLDRIHEIIRLRLRTISLEDAH
ncbi:hypothetical protein Aple_064720 [Acrocarpospora pleiomorpha]|uniref:Nucleoside phosphorylase domain-containing protein n=1 Tax=Acrocarpospora pleiomorpha TaxID=90975 RepID=A0A5M3XW46_9ACTN|nr:hypothetical protein [Acrocarpospora pleiomorpha]GES23573.1 hypothetical protein Aple_064720 [Acrocarpospora pleiomorpha]